MLIGYHKCRYCTGKMASEENNLTKLFPYISLYYNIQINSQWHPTLNGDLKPTDVLPKSRKKVYWVCTRDRSHIYRTTVSIRTANKNGLTGNDHNKSIECPICKKRIAHISTSLVTLYPDLVNEWNYSRNTGIDPNSIVPGSSKKVWWKCKKNGEHEWRTEVRSRTVRKTGNVMK